MSEDLNQLPSEPEESGQAQAESGSPQEPARELQPTPPVVERPRPLSESIIPEQPGAAYPLYPPPPEFYAQMPIANPQGASLPPPQPPVPGFSQPSMQGAPGFPPPPLYGYGVQPSPYSYGFPPPPQAQPLPLGQAMRELPRQYKKILLKPGVRAFAEEQGKADWGIIWLQVLLLMIIEVGVSIPLFIAYNQALATNPSLASAGVDASLFSSPVFLFVEILLEALSVPLVFLIGVGIQYLVARAFKGMGSFKQQAYNQLLFGVPLGLISAAISLILSTFLGRTLAISLSVSTTVGSATPQLLSGPYLLILAVVDLVSLVISVYSIVQNVFAIMAAHRMSGGRATASVLIPYGVLFLVVLLFACAGALVAASSMSH